MKLSQGYVCGAHLINIILVIRKVRSLAIQLERLFASLIPHTKKETGVATSDAVRSFLLAYSNAHVIMKLTEESVDVMFNENKT